MNRRIVLFILASLALNYLMVSAQSVVTLFRWMGWRYDLLPDGRYFLPSMVLLLPFVPIFALKFRRGRILLAFGIAALALHALALTFKAQIPGTRRAARTAASDWAVETIRADWKGPLRDTNAPRSILDYHQPNRPIVDAHCAGVAYRLSGRCSNYALFSGVDQPDYIVDEPDRVNRAWWWTADYAVLAERLFGSRNFVIYKRVP